MTAHRPLLIIVFYIIVLSACSLNTRKDSAPTEHIDVASIPNATPRLEPLSKTGNPPSYRVAGNQYYVMKSAQGYREQGIASWYGTKFHGRKTSSGETYDMYKMTAAHKTLPIPTYVKVTNLDNNRQVIVRVNDRGPFIAGRVIDLSYVAARKLGIFANGIGHVEVQAIVPEAAEPTSENKFIPAALSLQTSGQFYLQVGAFYNMDNASQLQAQIGKQTHHNAMISIAQTRDGALYRVRIGPVQDRETANMVKSQLYHSGFTTAHVVTNRVDEPK